MQEIYFNNINELYNRVLPVLKLKQKEFKNENHMVGINNIWFCLSETKWKKSINLTLYDVVNDIITLEYKTLKDYYKEV